MAFGFCGEDGEASDLPRNYKVVSSKFDVTEEESKDPIDATTDTDGDGVPDYVEIYFDMDINNGDTDGDGLSDYTEMYNSDTDPTLVDSDENGISDAQEDSDDDQLTNAEEQEVGTNGNIADTDEDEFILGLDPKNPKTDGIVLRRINPD